MGAGFDSAINGHFHVWVLHPVGTQGVGETDDPIGFFVTHEVKDMQTWLWIVAILVAIMVTYYSTRCPGAQLAKDEQDLLDKGMA